MLETHFYNVNEDGIVYGEHDTFDAALATLQQFPNDIIVVTLGPWLAAEPSDLRRANHE